MLIAFGFAICAESGNAALINGRNYVALMDWAAANGMNAVWSQRGTEIIVTGRAARLVFDVDSAQTQINGVNVRLSFPVANVKGAAYISQLDLDKTIRPLLSPSRYLDPGKITTICLDPGHGGKDTGNRVGGSFFGHSEKTYTLLLADELARQLKLAGFNAVLTRSKDVFVDLPSRPALANRVKADLFVSLHFNAAISGKADVAGAETYCITPVGASSSNAQGEGGSSRATPANRDENQSLLLAYQVQKSLTQNLHEGDRGVRRARFAVLRDATMPAILIEGGYMTQPAEGKKIFDSDYRKQMAAAIVKGIQAYQKLGSAFPAVTPPKKSPAARKSH
jgi:N-acetylmuramoyl-L-alanine amidase